MDTRARGRRWFVFRIDGSIEHGDAKTHSTHRAERFARLEAAKVWPAFVLEGTERAAREAAEGGRVRTDEATVSDCAKALTFLSVDARQRRRLIERAIDLLTVEYKEERKHAYAAKK